MEFNNEKRFQDELDTTQNNHHEGLNNISLNDSDNENVDKKKYLLLGIALLTIFIITVVVINFMSNVNDDTSNLVNNSNISQDNILEGINPEQKYQEIIEKRAEILKKEEAITYTESVKEQEPISTSEEIQEPQEIEKVKKAVVVKQEVISKKVSKIPVPETTKFSTSTKPKGSFIQLGAFSKYPTKKYLDNIKSKGYNYKVYKVEINGKLYHKVLVGPYTNQTKSRSKLSNIRKNLKSPKAFIYQ